MRILIPLALLLAACRADPGDPSYLDPGTASGDSGTTDMDFLAGPDPYEDGVPRLTTGLFYEGDASEALVVDDTTRHYYIYSDTYTQTVDLDDRVEGREADVLVHTGGDWWGGGITWDEATDLSDWTALRLSAKAESSGIEGFGVAVTGGGSEALLAASDYGFEADGTWHHLVFPAADFAAAGADLTAVTGPLVLLGAAGSGGEELRLDNHYWTQEAL